MNFMNIFFLIDFFTAEVQKQKTKRELLLVCF